MQNRLEGKFSSALLAGALMLAGAIPARAQAPFPGAVEVCVDGERGWVPASHPLASTAACPPTTGAIRAPTPPTVTSTSSIPGGVADRTMELGHLYMDGYGEVVHVIGVVRPTVIPGTFWILESLGPRACGALSYWPVDRRLGDGHWQEITEWTFTGPCTSTPLPQ